MEGIKIDELDLKTQAIFLHYQKFTLEGLASNHQGVACKFGRYAGMQCLSNCTAYLLYTYYNGGVPLKDRTELDHVLNVGSKIDFVLRQGGSIAPDQYVQIAEIPGTVITSQVNCHIYQSNEIFGLLGVDAPVIHDDVRSLKHVLTRNYNRVTQYMICICNAMALAVVIKDKRYYLFNPHCVPGIANSVAHVISTPDADDLVSYVGPTGVEYTGAFLYFVPAEVDIGNHAAFIANHYKVLRFNRPNAIQVDVSEADGGGACIRELPKDSSDGAPADGNSAPPLESKRTRSAESAKEVGQKLVKRRQKKGFAPYTKSKPPNGRDEAAADDVARVLPNTGATPERAVSPGVAPMSEDRPASEDFYPDSEHPDSDFSDTDPDLAQSQLDESLLARDQSLEPNADGEFGAEGAPRTAPETPVVGDGNSSFDSFHLPTTRDPGERCGRVTAADEHAVGGASLGVESLQPPTTLAPDERSRGRSGDRRGGPSAADDRVVGVVNSSDNSFQTPTTPAPDESRRLSRLEGEGGDAGTASEDVAVPGGDSRRAGEKVTHPHTGPSARGSRSPEGVPGAEDAGRGASPGHRVPVSARSSQAQQAVSGPNSQAEGDEGLPPRDTDGRGEAARRSRPGGDGAPAFNLWHGDVNSHKESPPPRPSEKTGEDPSMVKTAKGDMSPLYGDPSTGTLMHKCSDRPTPESIHACTRELDENMILDEDGGPGCGDGRGDVRSGGESAPSDRNSLSESASLGARPPPERRLPETREDWEGEGDAMMAIEAGPEGDSAKRPVYGKVSADGGSSFPDAGASARKTGPRAAKKKEGEKKRKGRGVEGGSIPSSSPGSEVGCEGGTRSPTAHPAQLAQREEGVSDGGDGYSSADSLVTGYEGNYRERSHPVTSLPTEDEDMAFEEEGEREGGAAAEETSDARGAQGTGDFNSLKQPKTPLSCLPLDQKPGSRVRGKKGRNRGGAAGEERVVAGGKLDAGYTDPGDVTVFPASSFGPCETVSLGASGSAHARQEGGGNEELPSDESIGSECLSRSESLKHSGSYRPSERARGGRGSVADGEGSYDGDFPGEGPRRPGTTDLSEGYLVPRRQFPSRDRRRGGEEGGDEDDGTSAEDGLPPDEKWLPMTAELSGDSAVRDNHFSDGDERRGPGGNGREGWGDDTLRTDSWRNLKTTDLGEDSVVSGSRYPSMEQQSGGEGGRDGLPADGKREPKAADRGSGSTAPGSRVPSAGREPGGQCEGEDHVAMDEGAPGPGSPLVKKKQDNDTLFPHRGDHRAPEPANPVSLLVLANPPSAPVSRAAEDMLTDMASLKRKRSRAGTASDSEDDAGPNDYHAHQSKSANWGDALDDDIWIDDVPEPARSPESPDLGSERLFSSSSEESLHTADEGGDDGAGEDEEGSGLEEDDEFEGEGARGATAQGQGVDFSEVDTFIGNMRQFSHRESLPLIVDASISRGFREANALHTIDKLITNIIIESGVVTGPAHPSKAKNLLRFIVLWGRKLGIPTRELETFMETELEISRLCSAIDDGAFPEGLFLSHVLTKVNRCLPAIYTQTRGIVKKIASILTAETQKVEGRETVADPRGYAGILTEAFDKDAYIICTKGESVEIVKKIAALREAVAARNAEIARESNSFEALMGALRAYGPVPEGVGPMESQPGVKDRAFAEAVGEVMGDLTERVRNVTSEFTDSLAAGHMDTTYLPDLETLIQNIDSTIRLLGFAARELRMEKKPLLAAAQQLTYMGGELAAIANADWAHRPAEPVTQVKEINDLRSRLAQLQKEDENAQATERILADVEGMLDDITSQRGEGGAVSRTLTVPMLENYLKNAGALIGESHNEKYLRLKERLRELASSEDFLVNLINTTTLFSVTQTLAKIEQILGGSPHLATSEKVRQAFEGAGEQIIADAMEAVAARDPARLDVAATGSLPRFLRHSPAPGAEDTGAALFALSEAVKLEKGSKGRIRWRGVDGKLSDAHSLVARSAAKGAQKRKLFALIQGLRKDYAAQEQREIMEDWKAFVTEAPINSMEDVNDILRAAPNEEAREFAAKKLEERVREMREAEAKLEKEAEEMLTQAVKRRGLQCWGRIQNAFDNMAFGGITGEDWAAVAAEFQREGSTLSSTLPGQLSKLTDKVEAEVEALLLNKVVSMLPNGPAFKPPAFDWLTPYRAHMNFYLKSFPLPKLNRQAEAVEAKMSQIEQAIEGADVYEAVAGTPLEAPVARALRLLRAARDEAAGLKGQIDEGERAYVQGVERAGEGGEPPAKPKAEIPKKLLTYEQTLSLANLPEDFQKNVLQNETLMLNQLREYLGRVTENINSLESRAKTSRGEANARLAAVIEENLPQANVSISSRRLDRGDPVGFLEGIVRDKQIVESDPYSATRESLVWLHRTFKALLPLCPASLKRRMELLGEEILREKGRAVELHELELRAHETDDVGVLTEAIETLEAKRVTGGKAAVEGWVKKRDAYRKMVEDLALRSEVEKRLGPLVEKSREALDAPDLAVLQEEAAALLLEAKTGGLDKSAPETHERVLELQMYLRFKLDFLKHYLDSQRPVFEAAPLSRALYWSNSQGERESRENGGEGEGVEGGERRGEGGGEGSPSGAPLRLAPRLSIYRSLARQATKFPARWLETRPSVDPVPETLVPNAQEPPIHLQPVFSNFLELLLFLPETHPRVGPGRGPLYGTLAKRLGVELRDMLDNQWGDIAAHVQGVLDAYRASRIGSARDNPFFAMTLFAHAVNVAARGLDAGRRNPEAEVLPVTHRQWAQLLLATRPELAAACLRAPSLRGAVEVLRTVAPSLRLLTPTLFLEDMYFPRSRPEVDHLKALPPPRAFLFRPGRWPAADVTRALWGSDGFAPLFPPKEDGRARAGFLLWALLTVDHVVLGQLWSTLPPLDRGLKSPLHLLYALAAAEYPNTVPDAERESGGEPGTPYPYGPPTGSYYTLGPTEAGGAEKVPVTGFEVAVGCLLRGVSAHIFIDSERPWAPKTNAGGEIDLVAPVLDCTGAVDPFKSLKAVPRKTLSPSAELFDGLAGREEVEVFGRQAAWLWERKRGGRKRDRFIVVLDPNNYLKGSYLGNARPPGDAPPVELAIEENKNWPAEALAPNLQAASPIPKSRVAAEYKKLTEKYMDLALKQVFAEFPGSVHDPPDSREEEEEGEGEAGQGAEEWQEEEWEKREEPRPPRRLGERGRREREVVEAVAPAPRDYGRPRVPPRRETTGGPRSPARDRDTRGGGAGPGPRVDSRVPNVSEGRGRPRVQLSRSPKPRPAASQVQGPREEVGFSPGRARRGGSTAHAPPETDTADYIEPPKSGVGAGSGPPEKKQQGAAEAEAPAPSEGEGAAQEAPGEGTPEPASIGKTSKGKKKPLFTKLPPSSVDLKDLFKKPGLGIYGGLTSPRFSDESESEGEGESESESEPESPNTTARPASGESEPRPLEEAGVAKQNTNTAPFLDGPVSQQSQAPPPPGRARPAPAAASENWERGAPDTPNTTPSSKGGRVKVKLPSKGETQPAELKPKPEPAAPDHRSPSAWQRSPLEAAPGTAAPRVQLGAPPRPRQAAAVPAEHKSENKKPTLSFDAPPSAKPQSQQISASTHTPQPQPSPPPPPLYAPKPPKINLNLRPDQTKGATAGGPPHAITTPPPPHTPPPWAESPLEETTYEFWDSEEDDSPPARPPRARLPVFPPGAPRGPSVSHTPIELEHILNGDYPQSPTTDVEEALDEEPVRELYLHEEPVTEGKHALLELISNIRARVVQTTRLILDKINQIQFLYL
ncbi:large tegument protein [Equid gammaherpesvirus 2]|nr:large tegument protein [Equid gammaherpesvirus 2]